MCKPSTCLAGFSWHAVLSTLQEGAFVKVWLEKTVRLGLCRSGEGCLHEGMIVGFIASGLTSW